MYKCWFEIDGVREAFTALSTFEDVRAAELLFRERFTEEQKYCMKGRLFFLTHDIWVDISETYANWKDGREFD